MTGNQRGLMIAGLSMLALAAVADQVRAGERRFWRRDAVEGSGRTATEARKLDSFDRIKVFGPFDLRVGQGKDQDVVVTFDDNLLEFVETRVKGHTLLISSEESFDSDHACTIDITIPELTDISTNGSGDIEIERFRGESLDVEVSGSGDVTINDLTVRDLRYEVAGSGDLDADKVTADDCEIVVRGSGNVDLTGTGQDLEIEVHGSGDVDAGRFAAEAAIVNVYGSGDVEVRISGALDAAVYGSGDIVYHAESLDKISTHVSGSGSIRKR